MKKIVKLCAIFVATKAIHAKGQRLKQKMSKRK